VDIIIGVVMDLLATAESILHTVIIIRGEELLILLLLLLHVAAAAAIAGIYTTTLMTTHKIQKREIISLHLPPLNIIWDYSASHVVLLLIRERLRIMPRLMVCTNIIYLVVMISLGGFLFCLPRLNKNIQSYNTHTHTQKRLPWPHMSIQVHRSQSSRHRLPNVRVYTISSIEDMQDVPRALDIVKCWDVSPHDMSTSSWERDVKKNNNNKIMMVVGLMDTTQLTIEGVAKNRSIIKTIIMMMMMMNHHPWYKWMDRR
jgi:hypothetical protein